MILVKSSSPRLHTNNIESNTFLVKRSDLDTFDGINGIPSTSPPLSNFSPLVPPQSQIHNNIIAPQAKILKGFSEN